MFFLLHMHDDRRIRIRKAQKHVDPVDPDPAPEHCFFPFFHTLTPEHIKDFNYFADSDHSDKIRETLVNPNL
jgi:hypothetical protein